jgi:hypothetical protein
MNRSMGTGKVWVGGVYKPIFEPTSLLYAHVGLFFHSWQVSGVFNKIGVPLVSFNLTGFPIGSQCLFIPG